MAALMFLNAERVAELINVTLTCVARQQKSPRYAEVAPTIKARWAAEINRAATITIIDELERRIAAQFPDLAR